MDGLEFFGRRGIAIRIGLKSNVASKRVESKIRNLKSKFDLFSCFCTMRSKLPVLPSPGTELFDAVPDRCKHDPPPPNYAGSIIRAYARTPQDSLIKANSSDLTYASFSNYMVNY